MRMSWQYLAGFFDGEGSLSIVGTGGLKACICQAGDKGHTVLHEIQEFLRLKGVKSYVSVRPPREVYYQTQWEFRITRRPDFVKFAQGVLPFLFVKKDVTENLLRFLIIYPPRGNNRTAIIEATKTRMS